jgi:hypothetical protein
VPRWNPLQLVTSLVPEPGPKRLYSLATLINMFGSGMLLVSLPLYFTQIAHLSTAEVGIGLTVAAIATLLAGLPLGELADRKGPLEVAKPMLLVQCVATVGFLFIHNVVAFAVVASIETVAGRAIGAAEGVLLRRVAEDGAAAYRSSTLAITNLGFSFGFIASGIAIQIGTPDAYHVLIIADALSFLATWLVLRGMPYYGPLPRPAAASRWGAAADRPFLAYTVLAAGFTFQFSVLTLLLPLWVTDHTHAPRWCIPLALVVNTVLIVLLQMRLGGKVQTIRQGGAAWRLAGVTFLISCSLLALAAGLPGWAALLVVVAAVAVHTFGEIWHMAGGFAIRMGLAPVHSQGQYDGLLFVIAGIGAALAPALLLSVVMGNGRPGLIGLGVFLVAISLAMPLVARWGERTRPTTTEAEVAPEIPEVPTAAAAE